MNGTSRETSMAQKRQKRTASPTTAHDIRSSIGAIAVRAEAVDERRRRVGLRRLVDEMLAEIRAAANEDNWTSSARAQAERDLARIMDQVRAEATRGNGPTPRRATGKGSAAADGRPARRSSSGRSAAKKSTGGAKRSSGASGAGAAKRTGGPGARKRPAR